MVVFCGVVVVVVLCDWLGGCVVMVAMFLLFSFG